jgi:tetratricopeptide (TPR) repeat protein
MESKDLVSFFQGLTESEKTAVKRFSCLSKAEFPFEKVFDGDTIPKKQEEILLNECLDALTMDIPLEFEADDDVELVKLKIKRRLLQIRTLQIFYTVSKGPLVVYFLEQIIEKSKEYEIFNLLVEALLIKKYFIGLRQGMPAFRKINEEIEWYEGVFNKSVFAMDAVYKYMVQTDYIKFQSEAAKVEELKNNIERLRKDYQVTKSIIIKYYLHILLLGFYETHKEFDLAVQCCRKILNILKKEKCIRKSDRLGHIYSNLAHFQCSSFNYHEAKKNCLKAITFYTRDSYHMLQLHNLMFAITFYQNNLEEAQFHLNELCKHKGMDVHHFRRSRFQYYQACLHFAKGEFRDALNILRQPLELEKDKARANISLRILNIMVFVELNKLNEASLATEALRKFVERQKKNMVSDRDHLIVKTLMELERNNFEYFSNNKMLNDLKRELKSRNTNVSWAHHSTELIPFHSWMQKIQVKPLKTRMVS